METEAKLREVRRTSVGKCLTLSCRDGSEEELIVDEILLRLATRQRSNR